MDATLAHAHGTVMSLAWMVFGSTGVLIARYGRVLHFGNQRQMFGKSIWFQTHRFLLSLSSLLTLVGFFFILVNEKGQWVNLSSDSKQLFAHSIFGCVIICCVVVQIWLALYRCHPHSRFRFIFNWSHRIIGAFSFGCSLCNIFLISFVLPERGTSLNIIVSLWAVWIIIVVFLFETIQYQYRKASALMAINTRVTGINREPINANPPSDTEVGARPNVDNVRLNKVKLVLFLIHAIISVVLCIPLIVLIWN